MENNFNLPEELILLLRDFSNNRNTSDEHPWRVLEEFLRKQKLSALKFLTTLNNSAFFGLCGDHDSFIDFLPENYPMFEDTGYVSDHDWYHLRGTFNDQATHCVLVVGGKAIRIPLSSLVNYSRRLHGNPLVPVEHLFEDMSCEKEAISV